MLCSEYQNDEIAWQCTMKNITTRRPDIFLILFYLDGWQHSYWQHGDTNKLGCHKNWRINNVFLNTLKDLLSEYLNKLIYFGSVLWIIWNSISAWYSQDPYLVDIYSVDPYSADPHSADQCWVDLHFVELIRADKWIYRPIRWIQGYSVDLVDLFLWILIPWILSLDIHLVIIIMSCMIHPSRMGKIPGGWCVYQLSRYNNNNKVRSMTVNAICLFLLWPGP